MASLLCSRRHPTWSGDDGDLLAMVALELSGEEDQSAIRQRRVTGRSLAAEECAELAAALRSWARRVNGGRLPTRELHTTSRGSICKSS